MAFEARGAGVAHSTGAHGRRRHRVCPWGRGGWVRKRTACDVFDLLSNVRALGTAPARIPSPLLELRRGRRADHRRRDVGADGSGRVGRRSEPGHPCRVFASTAPRRLQFPVTLHELEQGSGGIPFWEGGGAMGDHYESCGVAVWLGPNASAPDRSAVLSVLQAIKPS
jgi:hypothetical protein